MGTEINKIKKRIPSLDGLRAISILFVLISHAFRPKLIKIGDLGVLIFFVISSYLIVGILIIQLNSNKFSIKTFYFKRILRTFPVFYIYLLFLFLLLNFLNIFNFEQFWRAPIYLANYNPMSNHTFQEWFVGHSWSLAVEEQFYIMIALLFLFIKKEFIKKEKLVMILVAIVLLIPIIRTSYLYFKFIPNVLSGSLHRSFETVADSLAVGSIIAITEKTDFVIKTMNFFKKKTFILAILIISLMILNSSTITELYGYKPKYVYNLVGLTIINFSIGIIMIIYINYPKLNIVAKLLNTKPFITIGLWSYSIYVWQQVWLYSWHFSLWYKFLGVFACAIFSYYCIELPFLKIRDNYLLKNKK